LYCWDIFLNLSGIVGTSPGPAVGRDQLIGTKPVLPGFGV